ncbi:MAG: N-acetylmuramoyl-L-alanine amidase [bacterium]
MTGIRHGVKDSHTRVVLDLSSHVRYEIKRFDNPERIAINLDDARVVDAVRRFDIDEGVVHRVRINRLSWGTQVVLDLRSTAEISDFYLAPVDDMPPRIVLDLQPPVGAVAASQPDRHPKRIRDAEPVDDDAANVEREFVVAIDAGHGGTDPGAIGGGLVEKHVALDLARRIEREIDERPGFNAVLTRDGDVYLDLVERTRIAKKKGADIFVSVHMNSAKRKSARGVEVFFLSPAGAEATADRFLSNKKTAARELGIEEPQNDDVMHMLVDVNQQAMMQRSSLLAEEILVAMERRRLPPTRGIKQRSFAVLKSIDMPSVMVEAGFITNSRDASIYKHSEGKQDAARAIADGIVSFLEDHPPPAAENGKLLVHKVTPGDTLWKLSRRYGTTVASIQKSNRLGNSECLRVGQKLVIREGNVDH